MDDKRTFDWSAYMADLVEHNRLCQEHRFTPCVCSGLGGLEGILQQFRTAPNFVCTTDTSEESTRYISGGWFKRRVFITFILARYNPLKKGDWSEKMSLCRELFRQFQSRFIVDVENMDNELLYLNTKDIVSKELGASFLNSCTGLYFRTTIDEPTDLTYNEAEWK